MRLALAFIVVVIAIVLMAIALYYAKPNHTIHAKQEPANELLIETKTNTTRVKNIPIQTELNEEKILALIELAKNKIGSPYKDGKSGPDEFDCSGFVYYLFQAQGHTVPRTSLGQSKSGKPLDVSELQIGDLVFFDTSKKGQVNHSGIFLGDNRFIHASSGKANGVTISLLDGWYKDKFKWGTRNPLR